MLAPYAVLVREAARLRRDRYDVAVVLRPDHWWGALLALVAGIPVRVGAATPETTPLLTHARTSVPGEHATERPWSWRGWRGGGRCAGVSNGSEVNDPSFRFNQTARAAAQDFWARHALDGQRVVAVQPSAGAVLKSWPVDRWARVADGLIERGSAVLLIGGPDDRPVLASDSGAHGARASGDRVRPVAGRLGGHVRSAARS